MLRSIPPFVSSSARIFQARRGSRERLVDGNEGAAIKIRREAESLAVDYRTKFVFVGTRVPRIQKRAYRDRRGYFYALTGEGGGRGGERAARESLPCAAWPSHFGLRIANAALTPKRIDRVT